MRTLRYIIEEIRYSLLTIMYIIEGGHEAWSHLASHPAHARRHPTSPTQSYESSAVDVEVDRP